MKIKSKSASVPVGPIRMDVDLHNRLKAHAAIESRSVANVINLAVREYLDKHAR